MDEMARPAGDAPEFRDGDGAETLDILASHLSTLFPEPPETAAVRDIRLRELAGRIAAVCRPGTATELDGHTFAVSGNPTSPPNRWRLVIDDGNASAGAWDVLDGRGDDIIAGLIGDAAAHIDWVTAAEAAAALRLLGPREAFDALREAARAYEKARSAFTRRTADTTAHLLATLQVVTTSHAAVERTVERASTSVGDALWEAIERSAAGVGAAAPPRGAAAKRGRSPRPCSVPDRPSGSGPEMARTPGDWARSKGFVVTEMRLTNYSGEYLASRWLPRPIAFGSSRVIHRGEVAYYGPRRAKQRRPNALEMREWLRCAEQISSFNAAHRPTAARLSEDSGAATAAILDRAGPPPAIM